MAHAVVYTEFGGPEVLQLIEFPDPVAGKREVVVAVRAASVNPIDWKLRSAIRPSPPIEEPRRVGSDAAGVVESVGKRVEGVSVGDHVIITGANGAYATHVVTTPDKLTPKPAGLGWEQAAAIGIAWGTAYQALKSLGVGEGDTLLLHGGAGGVGQAAIQFAKLWGAETIATASEANHERLRELGAIPVVYGDGLTERIREAAPQGVTVALDAAGTDEAIESSLELVEDRNRIGTIVQGARAADWGIRAWSGGSPEPLTDEEQAWRHEAVGVTAELAAEGRVDIEIAARFLLDQAADAQSLSQNGHVRGKIVLDI